MNNQYREEDALRLRHFCFFVYTSIWPLDFWLSKFLQIIPKDKTFFSVLQD